MHSEQGLVCLTGHTGEPSHFDLKPGQTCLHGPTASFFREDKTGGCLQACLPHVTSLRLANGARVIEYKLQLQGLHTTLSVKFVEGAQCRITFDSAGDLEHLEGTKVLITCTAGQLIVGSLLGVSSGATCFE
jgi:hypothetical protein